MSNSYGMKNMGGGGGTRLGGKAFNHSTDADAEREYDRLRDLAHAEGRKRGECFDKSHQAYERGDGAGAKQFSNEGKAHAQKMDEYNRQASDYIFRENNANGRVADDTIDLHGQYVEEAARIVEDRIRYAQQSGQDHLHVIVGKGNHSVDHIQKIKPRVEQICQQLGLQFATEENAGRMYVNLQGGPAIMPPAQSHQGQGQHYNQGYGQNQGYQQPQQNYQQGYQAPQNAQYAQQGQQQQGNNNNDEMEKLARKWLPMIFRKLKQCFC